MHGFHDVLRAGKQRASRPPGLPASFQSHSYCVGFFRKADGIGCEFPGFEGSPAATSLNLDPTASTSLGVTSSFFKGLTAIILQTLGISVFSSRRPLSQASRLTAVTIRPAFGCSGAGAADSNSNPRFRKAFCDSIMLVLPKP